MRRQPKGVLRLWEKFKVICIHHDKLRDVLMFSQFANTIMITIVCIILLVLGTFKASIVFSVIGIIGSVLLFYLQQKMKKQIIVDSTEEAERNLKFIKYVSGHCWALMFTGVFFMTVLSMFD